ncbi:MAG: two-component system, OmpR family, sensor histidine kinase SenX3, partial [Acidimicrobiaceae bacterium]
MGGRATWEARAVSMAVVLRVSDVVAIAAAVAVGLLLIAILLVVWRARRGLVRRVVNASLRLEETPSPNDHRFLDKNLARLERAIDSSVLARGEASVAVGRMTQALEIIPQGVVICDENGRVTFRNGAATTFSSARHGDALVGAAIEEMLRKAIDGDGETRTLDLFGPPRRTLVVTVGPLDDDRRTVGALGIIDDVSERRHLEAVRRDFVANISHELKTPIGALGLLAETLVSEDDPDI